MPLKSGKQTPKEREFTQAMIRSNDPVYSAGVAGYANPEIRGHELMRRPAVVAEVQARLAHRLKTEGAEVGLGTLIEIASDKSAPKAPRVMAAKVLVEMSGMVAGEAGGKELHQMSRAELQQAADDARRYLAELEAPVIEGEIVPSGGVFD